MKRTALKSDPEAVRVFQDRSRQPLARDPAKGLARTGGLRRTELQVKDAMAKMYVGVGRGDGGRHVTPLGPRPLDRVPPAQRKRAESPGPDGAPGSPGFRELQDSTTKALSVPFRARVPARTRTCVHCRHEAQTWHHWLPQEFLRVYMRGLARQQSWAPKVIRRRLRVWLRDERNLSPMCRACHDYREHSISGGWTAAEVPAEAWWFARELDDELEAGGRPREAVLRLEGKYP